MCTYMIDVELGQVYKWNRRDRKYHFCTKLVKFNRRVKSVGYFAIRCAEE